ncbi:Nn.00g083480.m01.CDS01 [Neocucurbitaria sp. VM-36]
MNLESSYGNSNVETAQSMTSGGIRKSVGPSSLASPTLLQTYSYNRTSVSNPSVSQSDSGFYDTTFLDTQSTSHQITKLAAWQDEILRLWYANNRCVVKDVDVLFFRGILKVEEEVIKTRLRQLFENDNALPLNLIAQDKNTRKNLPGDSREVEMTARTSTVLFPGQHASFEKDLNSYQHQEWHSADHVQQEGASKDLNCQENTIYLTVPIIGRAPRSSQYPLPSVGSDTLTPFPRNPVRYQAGSGSFQYNDQSMPVYNSGYALQAAPHIISNDDGDDDEEDDDDESEEEDPGDDDRADDPDDRDRDGQGGPSYGGPSNGSHNHNDNNDKDTNHTQGPGSRNDNFESMCHWDSPALWNFPSSISFLPLQGYVEAGRTNLTNYTIPIRWMRRVNTKGGTASVFRVEICLDPISGIPSARRTYAVKQYASTYKRLFEQELQAFTILHADHNEQTSIIGCYGSFQFYTRSGDTMLNLLLEYAECDLAEYWSAATPRCGTYKGLALWKMTYSIVEALRRLHEPRFFRDKLLCGSHMDLKPDNILLVSGGGWKLSDFGFAKFVAVRDEVENPGFQVDGGTRRYSPPELGRSGTRSKFVSRASDVWSLGCVLVEIILAMEICASEKSPSQRGKKNTKVEISGFHNGESIHPEVQHFYNRLRPRFARNHLIGQTLDIVEKDLLQVDPSMRLTAKELQYRLREMLQREEMARQSVDKSWWASRGWTFQEEYLEPKRLHVMTNGSREVFQVTFDCCAANTFPSPSWTWTKWEASAVCTSRETCLPKLEYDRDFFEECPSVRVSTMNSVCLGNDLEMGKKLVFQCKECHGIEHWVKEQVEAILGGPRHLHPEVSDTAQDTARDPVHSLTDFPVFTKPFNGQISHDSRPPHVSGVIHTISGRDYLLITGAGFYDKASEDDRFLRHITSLLVEAQATGATLEGIIHCQSCPPSGSSKRYYSSTGPDENFGGNMCKARPCQENAKILGHTCRTSNKTVFGDADKNTNMEMQRGA